MNMLRLNKEQDDKLNKALDSKIRPKFFVTKAQADAIKAKAEEIKKAASKS